MLKADVQEWIDGEWALWRKRTIKYGDDFVEGFFDDELYADCYDGSFVDSDGESLYDSDGEGVWRRKRV